MSDSQHIILPLHHSSLGSQTVLPAGSQPKTSPATHSAVPSEHSSTALSADPPTGDSTAVLSESHASSPTVPASNASSQTASATTPSSTISPQNSHATDRGSSRISTTDNDDPPPEPPAGYPKLALKMGDMPEAAIFRRFSFLNAQVLLYKQAELMCLENKLRRLQADDNEVPGSRSLYAKNWWYLSDSDDQEGGDSKQWKLVKKIERKLKDYNEMIIQQLKIVAVDPPGSYDLGYIQRFLISPDMDHGVLTGQDADIWGSMRKPDGHASDLLGLLGRHNEDFFSSWVTDHVADRLIKLQQRRKRSGTLTLEDFTDKKMLRWTFMVATALASALPILSIVILYWVQSIKVRLGLIAVFNVVLSFALAWFTSAKRAEVFAVSAAFSAVQVVFVQVGTNDPPGASG